MQETSKHLSIEEQLERTEREVDDLRRALDHSSIVAFTDSKGTITYVNDKFCEISKYSRSELVGQNHRIINSGHHSKEFFNELWKTISSGTTWKGEIKNKAKDGSFYWVFTTIIPFLTSKGRPFQYVAIRTDITELKMTQEQTERHRMALIHSEKMAGLGELAAEIAHELGNPLASITGRIEFLEMQLLAGKADQKQILSTIETVRQISDRMARIIRGMQSLSRDGTNDPFHKISIGRLIKDVLGLTHESFEKHQIKVFLDEINDNIEITCQETQISQVFVNLINNAKDAIKDLSEKWIKIELIDQKSFVEIAITDSGRGIPKEIQDKIMLPFFTTKPTGQGSGLGLSISNTIIQNHGGRIEIDTQSPHTRFLIRFPKTKKTSPSESIQALT